MQTYDLEIEDEDRMQLDVLIKLNRVQAGARTDIGTALLSSAGALDWVRLKDWRRRDFNAPRRRFARPAARLC